MHNVMLDSRGGTLGGQTARILHSWVPRQLLALPAQPAEFPHNPCFVSFLAVRERPFSRFPRL